MYVCIYVYSYAGMHVDESIVIQYVYVGRYYVGNAFLFDKANITQDKVTVGVISRVNEKIP